tara:strand:- start:556 stop:777 length:222 start_codon:yes stop_codon:yes gene_type:complete
MSNRDDSGALFTNDKKGNDKAPDWTGPCKVNGKDMRVSAWKNEDKNGNSYIGLKFSEPQAPKQPKQESDEIPF